ncbi:GNAT family N-acetyltransferase [Mucilaginibacter kameinonensis]|uniref:GNAT family N-acetyltransferase n=1 Tax=Mucilaginibacter kameinonensis TaxID=452286 RepID=UPI000EF75E14|nr:GNAT family N-acetyltransferase [Mucilaginibacter kameinonensis]
MPAKITVKKVTEQAELDIVHAIRREVFVVEQNCPPELEYENEDVSHHFLATVDGEPAGACRWRKTENGYKLERFAVLKAFRGFGLGAEMVKIVLADLPADADYIYLNSQTPAVPFYAKLGFEASGPEFEEAGIKHYKMVKK